MRHKVACKNCPSAHFPPDPEVLDIQKWPHPERVKTAFPCGWNGKRYCKGYCDQMGISDADLSREFGAGVGISDVVNQLQGQKP